MKNIILFNLKIVFNNKLNRYIYGLLTLVLIFTISLLNVKLGRNNISTVEHLFFLEQEIYFKFFTFFSNILFPIIFFISLISFTHSTSNYSVLPKTKLDIYYGWLGVIGLILLYLGIIFVAILLVKMGFLSKSGLKFINGISLILWVLGILFFSFFCINVYLSLIHI